MILLGDNIEFVYGGSRYRYVHTEGVVQHSFEYWKTHCSGKTLS